MKKIQIQHSLLLLLTAVIWGTAFVAQSVGMDYVGPFTFLYPLPDRRSGAFAGDSLYGSAEE